MEKSELVALKLLRRELVREFVRESVRELVVESESLTL